jgi:hypothetical protein
MVSYFKHLEPLRIGEGFGWKLIDVEKGDGCEAR